MNNTLDTQATETKPESDNLIFCYTRQQAIEDGVFVDVTAEAKLTGFSVPVAITSNLYHTHIEKGDETPCASVLSTFLRTLYEKIKESKVDDNFFATEIKFDHENPTTVWAVVEAQSPTDPSPAINIMLPEDY